MNLLSLLVMQILLCLVFLVLVEYLHLSWKSCSFRHSTTKIRSCFIIPAIVRPQVGYVSFLHQSAQVVRMIFPPKTEWGKVKFSIMSVHRRIPMWPHMDLLKLFLLGAPGPSPVPASTPSTSRGPARSCLLCNPYIYWQAGGWPSTERLLVKFCNSLLKMITGKACSFRHRLPYHKDITGCLFPRMSEPADDVIKRTGRFHVNM